MKITGHAQLTFTNKDTGSTRNVSVDNIAPGVLFTVLETANRGSYGFNREDYDIPYFRLALSNEIVGDSENPMLSYLLPSALGNRLTETSPPWNKPIEDFERVWDTTWRFPPNGTEQTITLLLLYK